MPKSSSVTLDRKQRRRNESGLRKDATGPAAKGAAGALLPRLLPWLAVALAVLVFAGTVGYQFVYDDVEQIAGNVRLQSWEYVPQYFLHDVWNQPGKEVSSSYYRPMFLVWLRLNQESFAWDPAGYHAMAVLLHALVTLLVYLLAVRTLKDRLAAGFAALIFAVHPLHVESVAWVSGANEPEFALFFLGAILCYLRWRDRLSAVGSQHAASYKLQATSQSAQRTSAQLVEHSSGSRTAVPSAYKWFLLSLACYALALLSKETAVMLCPLVFLYEWRWGGSPRLSADGCQPETSSKLQDTSCGAQRESRQPRADNRQPEADNRQPTTGNRQPAALQALGVTLPYVLLTGAYLWGRAAALGRWLPEVSEPVSRLSSVLSLPEVFWFYAHKMLWPLPTSAFYSLRLISHPGLVNFFLPVAAAAAALLGLWFWSRRSEAAGIASAWLLLPLAPPLLAISHFRFYDLVHDRYLYLPSVGLALLIALALRKLKASGEGRRNVAGLPAAQLGAVLFLVCLLGLLTVQQARQWASNEALYQHGIEVAPHNPLALTEWAMLLLMEQHAPSAAHRFAERALVEAPDDYQTLLAAGILRWNVRDAEGALPLLLRARQIHPDRRGAHFFLGYIYLQTGELREAERSLRQAIQVAPDVPDQHFLLGSALEKQGRLPEARSEYQAELRVKPGSTDAARRLAAVEARLNGQ
jgi:tetratricopeptide (TPR) repeat protein